MTGCSDPSAAPTAGNIVQILQRKCCQGLPAILVEPVQRHRNVSLSNPDSSLGTKNSRKERDGVSGGGGHNHHFVFSQNGGVLLTLQRFNKNRWRPLTAFPLKILDSVCSSVSGARIAASRHRGSALRATKVKNLYDYFK